MEEQTQRTFLYRFLPDPVRDFFFESGIDDIKLIAQQFGLSGDAEDQLDQIQQEVLFGYEAVDKVPNLIRMRLGYDQAQANRIALALIERRFLPIDSYLNTTAFRTFTSLGGNVNVAQVQKVEVTGATVRDTREELDEYLAVQAVLEGDEEEGDVDSGEEEIEEEVVAEPVQEPKDQSEVAEPPLDPGLEQEKLDRLKRAFEGARTKKPEKPAVKTMRAFDASQDRHQPERRGEKKEGEKVQSSEFRVHESKKKTKKEIRDSKSKIRNPKSEKPKPKAELAPPPPVVEVAKKKEKRSEKRDQRKVKAQQKGSVNESPISNLQSPTKEKVIAPKQHTKKPRTSILDVEHEAEVAAMMRKLKDTGLQAPRGLENEKIDDVKRRLSLTFPSAEIEKRFRVLVGARLSGVRSEQDFADALTRSIEKGGMGFDASARDRVIEDISAHVSGVQGQAEQKHKAEKEAFVQKRQEGYGVGMKKGDGRMEDAALGSPTSTVKRPPPPQGPTPSGAKAVLSTTSVPQKPVGPAQKPPVVDVKYERRLVGPIEELRRMNLDDFRRLPGDANEAMEAIRDDIQNLGDQDPGLRVRAIEGWRSSPLVATYQKILGAALHEGLPVSDILKDEKKNRAGLHNDEFQAIHALNKQLRY